MLLVFVRRRDEPHSFCQERVAGANGLSLPACVHEGSRAVFDVSRAGQVLPLHVFADGHAKWLKPEATRRARQATRPTGHMWTWERDTFAEFQ
jgi:hypothetical protein